mmetsp:Transcript_90273/g.252335  ORF Transcript_90273/g.252335 Transcript_90273/m.252335 type:complete len:269 (+) Transcript_90273:559-1365(+)
MYSMMRKTGSSCSPTCLIAQSACKAISAAFAKIRDATATSNLLLPATCLAQRLAARAPSMDGAVVAISGVAKRKLTPWRLKLATDLSRWRSPSEVALHRRTAPIKDARLPRRLGSEPDAADGAFTTAHEGRPCAASSPRRAWKHRTVGSSAHASLTAWEASGLLTSTSVTSLIAGLSASLHSSLPTSDKTPSMCCAISISTAFACCACLWARRCRSSATAWRNGAPTSCPCCEAARGNADSDAGGLRGAPGIMGASCARNVRGAEGRP